MTKTISFHSFRRGTGRSSLLSSLAAILATQGKRVGIVDANLQSPSAHILFGLSYKQIHQTLNEYLWGDCQIEEVVYDVSRAVRVPREQLLLIPSSDSTVKIMRILNEGFDVNRLIDAYSQFSKKLSLDYLFLDVGSGLNETVLISAAVSNTLILVMRPDHQDYQGVAATLKMAKQLHIGRILALVNDVPSIYEPSAIRQQVETDFDCEVAAVIPHSEHFLSLASEDIFVTRYPRDPLTRELEELALKL